MTEKEPSQSGTLSASTDSNTVANDSEVSKEGTSEQRAGTGFLAVMQSVGAAMLGVQSSRNKERDFTHGKPVHFIIGGLIGTLIFLLLIGLLVKYLIATN